jgi:hypothetical protein
LFNILQDRIYPIPGHRPKPLAWDPCIAATTPHSISNYKPLEAVRGNKGKSKMQTGSASICERERVYQAKAYDLHLAFVRRTPPYV